MQQEYLEKKSAIKSKLKSFKYLNEEQQFKEFLFCTLTPQSNAQKCWGAVLELSKLPNPTLQEIKSILKSRTRFHNNKSKYITYNLNNWKNVKKQLSNPNTIELRNWLAENVYGYGLKEAGHFLRNIGKSNNQIAILDRHILKNLKENNIIKDTKIKSKKHYLELEQSFLNYSKSINIPIDELDLLFWSKENGEIFK
ncbi:MAG: DNA lyase [Nanoarchaeota archaeon]